MSFLKSESLSSGVAQSNTKKKSLNTRRVALTKEDTKMSIQYSFVITLKLIFPCQAIGIDNVFIAEEFSLQGILLT